jgi:hypothetical protein
VHRLTKRRIGQLWIHHSGHDTSRGYGTKTREWQMDLVMHLDAVVRPDTDVSFTLTFPKARERTPANRDDFTPTDIALVNDAWAGTVSTAVKEKIDKGIVLKFFEALKQATARSKTVVLAGKYPAATIEEWHAACIERGLLADQKNPRALFAKHKARLLEANWIDCDATLAWILP